MTKTLSTACPLDCPDSCSLDVQVDDGKVVKLDGSHRNPVTQGYICAKVRRFPDHVYGEDRLRSPLRRVGAKGSGEFEEISWSEALDLLAERLRRTRQDHGGEAILPFSYGGSNGVLTHDTLDLRLWRRLGASRLARKVCAAATTAAAKEIYGKMAGVSYGDYRSARLIVVWGANPSSSGIHLVPHIRAAQKAGAKLVVVDPRRTPLAKRADLHLAVRPGADLPLALSVLRFLFEHGGADQDFLARHATGHDELRRRASPWTFERAAEACGLPADDIEAFARLYADVSPAVIRIGWGQERNRNGGSATAAVLALPAVAGKFGVRGGGYTASNSGVWSIDTEGIVGEPERETRTVNMNRLGRALLDSASPVHLLFVYNANPLSTLPRQDLVRRGLLREDLFTAVFEQVMTDTARYADLVLPATTFLEHGDLRPAYGAFALQRVEPAIAPVGEARSNPEVFEALLQRLELEKPGDVSATEILEHLLRHGGLDAVQTEALEQGECAEPPFGQDPVQLVDVFPGTGDQKIHLVPEALDSEVAGGLYAFNPDPATEDAPLALLSPATSQTICSAFGQFKKELIPVEMHPDDARERGLENGDEVVVRSEFGELQTRLRVTTDMRPGVATLPKGMWDHQSRSGVTGNVLVPDTYTDLAEGACFNDARVEITAAG